DGDEVARRAAGQLAAEAGGGPAAPDSPASPGFRDSSGFTGGERAEPQVVAVSVSRPLVPDRDDESGALVVLSAGHWTADELAGVTEACADAKHEIVGVVLACPVRSRPARSAGRPPKAAVTASATGDDAKGSRG
ncbi:polysaccharide biosynthesis protein, partial [Streptomyces sp. SID625]|nr:polysaccharide biosynthesis protein [Streptomyces sp. SID625]